MNTTRPRRWSAKEISFVRSHIKKMPNKQIVEQMVYLFGVKRSTDAICHKAAQLGVGYTREETLQILKSRKKTNPHNAINKFPGASIYVIAYHGAIHRKTKI